MNVYEQMMDYLKREGMQPEKKGETLISFSYREVRFLYCYCEDDEYYFRMALPYICDVTEDNREAMMEYANEMNRQYKLAKVCVVDDRVDVNVEMLLDTTPMLDELVPRVLDILCEAGGDFLERVRE